MQQAASVQVRVNGVPIKQVRLRGHKFDARLVIVDPIIGAFEIDDRDQRFHVEALDLDIPTELRAKLPNGGWRHVSVQALIATLTAATQEIPEGGDGDRCSWVLPRTLLRLKV